MAGSSPLQVRSLLFTQARPSAPVPASPQWFTRLQAVAGGLGWSPGRQSGASKPLQPPPLCGRSHLALLSPHPDAFAFRKELMTLGLVPESQLEPWASVWHPLQARAEPAHLAGHCCWLCCSCVSAVTDRGGAGRGGGGQRRLSCCRESLFTRI